MVSNKSIFFNAIEFVYTILFFLALFSILTPIFFELISFPNDTNKAYGKAIMHVLFILLLLYQLSRIYYILHHLDENMNKETHFIKYFSRRGYIRTERVIRIILALSIIILAKSTDNIIVTENYHWITAKLTELIQEYGLLANTFEPMNDYSLTAKKIAIISFGMIIVYILFLVWDIILAKEASFKGFGEDLRKEKLKKLLSYFFNKKISPKTIGNNICYLKSEKIKERMCGLSFFFFSFFYFGVSQNVFSEFILGALFFLYFMLALRGEFGVFEPILMPINKIKSIFFDEK